jgi:hypothetical protein
MKNLRYFYKYFVGNSGVVYKIAERNLKHSFCLPGFLQQLWIRRVERMSITIASFAVTF